jgi:Uma2 family endonuclease
MGMTLISNSLLERANEAGIRLEIISGVPIWEASPAVLHQRESYRIQQSIKPLGDCGCFHVADVYVKFSDDSIKRPDISIFCREPDELDEAVTLVPEAVVEIISKGYEIKDKEIAPKFYLENGVKDILVFDPRTLEIWHHTNTGVEEYKSPTGFTLECGCEIEI